MKIKFHTLNVLLLTALFYVSYSEQSHSANAQTKHIDTLNMGPNSKGRASLGDKTRVKGQINGHETAHDYYERGAGQPVILLPSLGRPASDFNELTTMLAAAGYHTIALNLNIGSSPELKINLLQMAKQVDDVVNSIDLKNHNKVFLIGHAFGNRLARAYSTVYSERVNAVVLLAAGGKVKIPKDVAKSLRHSFDSTLSPTLHRQAIRHAFFAKENTIPDYWLVGWDRKLATLQVYATQNTDYSQWWHAGEAPLLIVQGDVDTIAPASHTSTLLKSEYGDRVQILTVSPAGHALLPEKPKLIGRSIIDYFNKLPKFYGETYVVK